MFIFRVITKKGNQIIPRCSKRQKGLDATPIEGIPTIRGKKITQHTNAQGNLRKMVREEASRKRQRPSPAQVRITEEETGYVQDEEPRYVHDDDPDAWRGWSLGPDPEYFLAETRASPSGDPEAGVLPGVCRNSIPEYFFPNSLPFIARFRHRTRGITCALKSTGVAHSQQVFPRQDIALVILLSRVPPRPEPDSEPGGGPIP
ncbi:hypothetical protein F2Q69_00022572 [Brassica cretica]|uniref:Uncharacterized protein n=1 Tax=Brassica cretica TaxID=69181 RepID=A0A8S9QB50_BRACR|nr:hypothetical protein F2Q69_00022572 [Brassica cretica]